MRRSPAKILIIPALVVLVGGVIVGWVLSQRSTTGPVVLARDAVVGSWHAQQGGLLEFSVDGTFVGRDLPASMFEPSGGGRQSSAGGGRWELVPPVADPSGLPSEIRLIFTYLDRGGGTFATRLAALQRNGDVVLYFFVDDPDLDRRYEFVRLKER